MSGPLLNPITRPTGGLDNGRVRYLVILVQLEGLIGTRISSFASHSIKVLSLKFTSGNADRVTRVASARDVHSPSKQGSGFMASACMADFAVQTWV